MGFTPAQVKEMSAWEYLAALEGYIEANTPKDEGKLASAEADELWEWMQSKA